MHFKYNLKLLLFVSTVLSIFLYVQLQSNFNQVIKFIYKYDECYNYKQECLTLFKKIRHPKNGTIFRPPLSEIPKELYDEFTQNGWMPITKYWYINEVYSDSNLDSNKTSYKSIVSKSELNKWREKVRNKQPLSYYDTELQEMMFSYSNELKDKKIAIIGTQLPWIEAISLEIGTGKITTLDYTRKKYEQSDLLEWLHVNDFLDISIQNSNVEQYDNAASFSSIEHSGLGRYGDPLDPNGDIDAVRQVHCMLKPGGLFFIGLPSSKQEKGYIEFNAHRYYGFKRLELLFQGWKKLDETQKHSNHAVYVLRKKKTC